MISSIWSGVESSPKPPVMPAFEQKTFTGPKASTARSTSAWMASRAGHVPRHRHPADTLRHFLRSWPLVEIGDDHLGPDGGEPLGQGVADPVSAAGDDDALPFEVGH